MRALVYVSGAWACVSVLVSLALGAAMRERTPEMSEIDLTD